MNLEHRNTQNGSKSTNKLQITNYGLLNLFVNSKHLTSPKRFPKMIEDSRERKR